MKIKIEKAGIDFTQIDAKEYLEYFGYINPIFIGKDESGNKIYSVSKIGMDLPSVKRL